MTQFQVNGENPVFMLDKGDFTKNVVVIYEK